MKQEVESGDKERAVSDRGKRRTGLKSGHKHTHGVRVYRPWHQSRTSLPDSYLLSTSGPLSLTLILLSPSPLCLDTNSPLSVIHTSLLHLFFILAKSSSHKYLKHFHKSLWISSGDWKHRERANSQGKKVRIALQQMASTLGNKTMLQK